MSTSYQVKPSTIRTIVKAYQEKQQVKKKPRGGARNPSKLSAEHKATIRGWLDDDCSLTGEEIATRCGQILGVTVHPTTALRAAAEMHYSLKRVSLQPIARNTPETIEIRKEWML
jgi:transposase